MRNFKYYGIFKILQYFIGGYFLSKVWTIKVSRALDKLVEELVRELGYTGKAEFVREAVREAILRKNIGLLGLYSMDKLSDEKGDPFKALKKLLRFKVSKEIVENEIKEGRKEIEKLIKS